jgi:hypothetical protein
VRRVRSLQYLAPAIVALALPNPAWAHRDDYIDETFVYQTLRRHQLELEGWGDARGGGGQPWAGVYTGALEAGLTDRWMVDGALQARHDSKGVGFERGRVETRLRFADEGTWPVDVAASLEYELEKLGSGELEQMATPRLILSRDLFNDLNATLNLDLPITFAPNHQLSFAYAVGLRYPAEGVVRAGVEFKHRPASHEAIVFPQLWFALPAEITIKLGLGVGLSGAVPLLTARAVFEIEL